MSKLPRRKRQRGKRQNRQSGNKTGTNAAQRIIEQSDDAVLRHSGKQDAKHSGKRTNATPSDDAIGVFARTGKPAADSRRVSGGDFGKATPGVTGDGFAGAQSGAVPSRNGKTAKSGADAGGNLSRRGNGTTDRNPGQPDALPRGLRPPVKRTPDASYRPPEHPNAGKQSLAARPASTGTARKSPAPPKPSEPPEPYAALDLGTNNCRLLVALPLQRGRFRVIDGFSRIVRLGEGLSQTGRLCDEAMDRAIAALKVCARKLAANDIRHHRLIATEACRQAENGARFLHRVRNETGLKLEIIDRRTEAMLAAEGCGALMDRRADAAVLFDIGGGSSELVLIDRRKRARRIRDQIVSWTSVPIGVLTLAERHGGRHVDADNYQRMINDVHDHIDRFPGRDNLEQIWHSGRVHLLGTSGTVTTLAGIHLGLERYERRRVDGLWMSSGEIDAVLTRLKAMSYEERAASPCVGTERADLVLAGCAILEAIRQTWPSERMRIADRGMREGILTQLMDRDAAWRPPKRGKWHRAKGDHRQDSL